MTPEDLQEVVAAVIAALKTNGKTIDQLTAVTSLADTDNLEISNGKKVSFGKLKELVAAAVTVSAEEIKGWEMIESTDDLPEDPTQAQQEKAYVIADTSTMYVYVGYGGDTLDGLYQSLNMKGEDGAPGPPGADGHDGVDLGEVALINDLTTGGEGDALSAEMGKVLKDIIDGKIRLVTQGYYDELTKVNNVLYLIDNEDGESGSPLPSGYKQLTSISNPNTQKLDTGIVCNGRNYKFQFSFTLQSVVASAKIFSDSTSGGKMWYFGVRGGATMFYFCANNSYAGALNMQPATSTDYVVSSNMGAITINETSFNVDNTSQTTANRNTIHLFADPDGSNPCVATIYSFKILDTSDNLLFDGVPAQERATGNVGLYDLVSQTFKVLG